jgi:hypothetical protein
VFVGVCKSDVCYMLPSVILSVISCLNLMMAHSIKGRNI